MKQVQAREFDEAFDALNAVLVAAQAAGDASGEFNARLALGQILAVIGQPQVARIEAQRALELARSRRNAEAIGAAQTLLDRLPS